MFPSRMIIQFIPLNDNNWQLRSHRYADRNLAASREQPSLISQHKVPQTRVQGSGSETGRLHRCRLGRMSWHETINSWVSLQHWKWGHQLAIETSGRRCPLNLRSRISRADTSHQRSSLVERASQQLNMNQGLNITIICGDNQEAIDLSSNHNTTPAQNIWKSSAGGREGSKTTEQWSSNISQPQRKLLMGSPNPLLEKDMSGFGKGLASSDCYTLFVLNKHD